MSLLATIEDSSAAEASAFYVGDVVTLKSGGERMTVEHCSGDVVDVLFYAQAQSFSVWGGSGGPILRREKLPAAVLRKVVTP